MKKVTMVTLFSCFIAVLAVVFAYTPSAFADHSVTAKQASDAQNASDVDAEKAMRDFVLHVKEHREQIRNDDEHSEFRNAMRTDDGEWKSGTTYIITVNSGTRSRTLKAGEVISFHAEHPTATDKSLRHIPIFGQLMMMVEQAGEEAVCVKDDGDDGNYICAVKTTITNEAGAPNPVISVAGFHHELGEEDASKIRCPELGSEYFAGTGTGPDGEEFTRTSADMVDDKESLKNYLKTVNEHITTEINKVPTTFPEYAQLPDSRQRGLVISRLARLRPCWRDENEPWKSGSIYFYLIRYAGSQYGIFNGLTPEFEDATLRLYDSCTDIGRTVRDILEQQSDGFLEYYWSNPVKDDDRVTDESGNPIRGLSPGTSVKLGYFLTTNFGGTTKSDFVLGSGIYPEKTYYVPESGMCQDIPSDLSDSAREHLGKFPVSPEQEKDDGGCAIASGSGNEFEIAAFNLFLITVFLFLAVSFVRKDKLQKD